MNFKSIALVTATIVGTCFDSSCALPDNISLHRTKEFYGKATLRKTTRKPQTSHLRVDSAIKVVGGVTTSAPPSFTLLPQNTTKKATWRLRKAVQRPLTPFLFLHQSSSLPSLPPSTINGFLAKLESEKVAQARPALIPSSSTLPVQPAIISSSSTLPDMPTISFDLRRMGIERRLKRNLDPEYGRIPLNLYQLASLVTLIRKADPEYGATLTGFDDSLATRFSMIEWLLKAGEERPDLFDSIEFIDWKKTWTNFRLISAQRSQVVFDFNDEPSRMQRSSGVYNL